MTTPESTTFDPSTSALQMDEERAFINRLSRVINLQLLAFVVIFLSLSALVYSVLQSNEAAQARDANGAANAIGKAVALALEPTLATTGLSDVDGVTQRLLAFESAGQTIKLLFRPTVVQGEPRFFYIASAPTALTSETQTESARLAQGGVLQRMAEGCGDAAKAEVDGSRSGPPIAVIPVRTPNGCWSVIVTPLNALNAGALASAARYWLLPRVRITAIMFTAAALIALLSIALMRNDVARLRAYIPQGAAPPRAQEWLAPPRPPSDTGSMVDQPPHEPRAPLIEAPTAESFMSRAADFLPKADFFQAQADAEVRPVAAEAMNLSSVVHAFVNHAWIKLGSSGERLQARIADGIVIDGRQV